MANLVVFQLGVVVDLLVGSSLFKFADENYDGSRRPAGPLLCWHEEERCLIFDETAPIPRARLLSENLAHTIAAAEYRTWTRGRAPAEVRTINVDLEGRFRSLGKAAYIRYASDKWNGAGRWVLYKHKFERGVQAATTGRAYRICGGSLRVTRDGIEG